MTLCKQQCFAKAIGQSLKLDKKKVERPNQAGQAGYYDQGTLWNTEAPYVSVV